MPVDDPSVPEGVLVHAAAVDAAVREAVETLGAQLSAIDAALGPAAAALVDAADGGKRLRGALVVWSFLAHRSLTGTPDADADAVMGAAVAVELVHLSALVHDDVIDRSDTRRGRPSLHARFGREHGPEHGHHVAILLGDVLLAAAPDPLRTCAVAAGPLRDAQAALTRMQVEVMAGQFLDVDAAATGSADRDRALTIATLKSGRYSVSRPLELGALLAGVAPADAAELLAVGDPLGVAFQLRDDVLGVFGDPALTGKPAGSDLVEGKRTLLIAETLARLTSDARAAGPGAAGVGASGIAASEFERLLGDPTLDADSVALLTTTIEDSGARAAVESHIAVAAAEARTGIARLRIAPEDRSALERLADWMVTRRR
jgi:geranylgeranyl diphosphate synthase, type I